MRRDDHYTHTPDDAAAFERAHAEYEYEDEPVRPGDVLDDYEQYQYHQYHRIVPRSRRGFRVPPVRGRARDDDY